MPSTRYHPTKTLRKNKIQPKYKRLKMKRAHKAKIELSNDKLRAAVERIESAPRIIHPLEPKRYPIQAPFIMPGVLPSSVKRAPVQVAMDSAIELIGPSLLGQNFFGIENVIGFPGFQLLSQLATRAEYRAFASAQATEVTREWIEFTSKQDDDTDTADKIKKIEERFEQLKVRSVIGRACEHDCFFGRAQIFIDLKGQDRSLPLILDPRTIPQGSLNRITTVEAVWTTPNAYNALDPAAPDFYKPTTWFMLGQEVHASRLLTIVTRQLPDILKPAFNFAGMSLSQLAEPYVMNWLRTRQSVSDLINNFSITAIATAMEQVLQGSDNGAALFNRAALFTATRSNKGLMLIDKTNEELIQVNVPLGGLHELQAQAQEHMCSVSRTPAIVLTGISPSGLNASSDGEIRVYYDWIAAQQEAFWREPIDMIQKIVQLDLFGEIDPDIGFSFVPLYQMTPKELSEIREANGRTDAAYIAMSALAPEEVRNKLAKDPESGYDGLDTSFVPVPPIVQPALGEQPLEQNTDAQDMAKDHIVEEHGKFKLLSHEGKNLGVFNTREEAAKHEGQVEYFKGKK